MKYIKWKQVISRLGICYVFQMVVNNEQIRFQKGTSRSKVLSQERTLIFPERNEWEFEVGLTCPYFMVDRGWPGYN